MRVYDSVVDDRLQPFEQFKSSQSNRVFHKSVRRSRRSENKKEKRSHVSPGSHVRKHAENFNFPWDQKSIAHIPFIYTNTHTHTKLTNALQIHTFPYSSQSLELNRSPSRGYRIIPARTHTHTAALDSQVGLPKFHSPTFRAHKSSWDSLRNTAVSYTHKSLEPRGMCGSH